MLMAMHVDMMSPGEKGANDRACPGSVEKIEQTGEPSKCAVTNEGR